MTLHELVVARIQAHGSAEFYSVTVYLGCHAAAQRVGLEVMLMPVMEVLAALERDGLIVQIEHEGDDGRMGRLYRSVDPLELLANV